MCIIVWVLMKYNSNIVLYSDKEDNRHPLADYLHRRTIDQFILDIVSCASVITACMEIDHRIQYRVLPTYLINKNPSIFIEQMLPQKQQCCSTFLHLYNSLVIQWLHLFHSLSLICERTAFFSKESEELLIEGKNIMWTRLFICQLGLIGTVKFVVKMPVY